MASIETKNVGRGKEMKRLGREIDGDKKRNATECGALRGREEDETACPGNEGEGTTNGREDATRTTGRWNGGEGGRRW